MAVRCAHCGEELLGAVNRCWKCGQQFVARPTVEGLPPVRVEITPAAAALPALDAKVLDDASGLERADDVHSSRAVVATPASPAAFVFPPTPPPNPLVTPKLPSLVRRPPMRPNYAALGGTIAAVVLGVSGLLVGAFRWEGAIIGLIGLFMGIWGIYSQRRGWAMVGMLLCTVAIGLGTFTGVRMIYIELTRNAPIESSEDPNNVEFAPPP